MMRAMRLVVFSSLCLLLFHCGGTRTQILRKDPEWDQRRPMRVALLPLQTKDADQAAGAEILRRDLYVEFSKKPQFYLLEPRLVDQRLEEEGLLKNDAWRQLSPKELGHLLDVDTLMRASITRFGATYVLVQSNAGAGAEVELVDAPSGQVLWKIQKQVSSSRGLTGIPTGLSSVVLEPLRGLGSGLQTDLMRQLGMSIAASVDPNFERPKNQPLVPAPALNTAHIVYHPDSRYLNVDVEGTPGCAVSFTFPDFVSPYPCREFSPGQYRAGFLFPSAPVSVPETASVMVLTAQGTSTQIDVKVETE